MLTPGNDALPDNDLAPEPEVPQPLFNVGIISDGQDNAQKPPPNGLRAPRVVAPVPQTRVAGQPKVQLSAHKAQVPLQPPCRDLAKQVVIESGLRGYADVFANGHASALWAPASTGQRATLAATEPIAAFVLRTGTGLVLGRPKLMVSDASILTVQLAERRADPATASSAKDKQKVLLSKHFCRKSGEATVTVELSFLKVDAEDSPQRPCTSPVAPAIFSYQKVCAAPGSALGDLPHTRPQRGLEAEFERALVAKPKMKPLGLVHHRSLPDRAPWHGIVPSGGGRTVLLVVLIFALIAVLYEFGTYWLSQKIKKTVLEMGPQVFGLGTFIDDVNFSLWYGQMTVTIRGFQLSNPPGHWKGEYFLRVNEVRCWMNMYKMATTFLREIEIRQLLMRDMQINVEVDGYFAGETNLNAVLKTMEKNNKQWIKDLDEIQKKHGIDAAGLWKKFTHRVKDIMKGLTVNELTIEGIGCSASTTGLGGAEIALKPIHEKDFSTTHNAVGLVPVARQIATEVIEDLISELAGKGLGHFAASKLRSLRIDF